VAFLDLIIIPNERAAIFDDLLHPEFEILMDEEEDRIAESIRAKLISLYCSGETPDYLQVTVSIGIPGIPALSPILSVEVTTLPPCPIQFK